VILETIEKYSLIIQGLENCTPLEPELLLDSVRQEFPKLDIQLFRADRIAGKEHLTFAASSAIRAFRQHQERARTLAVELLLYASCQSQITKAIQRLGVRPQTREIVFAALAIDVSADRLAKQVVRKLQADSNDDVIQIRSANKTMELVRAYEITEREIESAPLTGETENSALQRLIIEKGALLAVEK